VLGPFVQTLLVERAEDGVVKAFGRIAVGDADVHVVEH
jgi:hypothetical protein